MPRINIYLPENELGQLRDYAYKTYGEGKVSLVVRLALKDYLGAIHWEYMPRGQPKKEG